MNATITMTDVSRAASQAARDYASAVVNETGYGIAAVTAAAAIQAGIESGLTRGDASETVATYYGDALARLGKPGKVGGTKVGQLANAYADAVSHGFGTDAVDLMGAIYQARVGKIDGGVKTIAAALEAAKDLTEEDAVQAMRGLPRAGKPARKPLTVEQAQKMIGTIIEADWNEADGMAVLQILKQATVTFAGQEPR